MASGSGRYTCHGRNRQMALISLLELQRETLVHKILDHRRNLNTLIAIEVFGISEIIPGSQEVPRRLNWILVYVMIAFRHLGCGTIVFYSFQEVWNTLKYLSATWYERTNGSQEVPRRLNWIIVYAMIAFRHLAVLPLSFTPFKKFEILGWCRYLSESGSF